MEEENLLIDQSPVAQDLSDKIPYEFKRYFLVKPLDVIKVKKEFSKPVPTDSTPKKDENGIEAVDFDKVETEVKEVESDYRKGVVLKVPFEYTQTANGSEYREMSINVGDVIIYPARGCKYFDLLKDSQLVFPYDIVAVER